MDKILLVIFSTIIGVVSTHAYTFFKERKRKSHIERQLKLELSDIKIQLQKQLTVYEDAFNFIDQNSYPNVLPRSILAPIYDEFFGEVLLSLKPEQRLAYQQIHHDISIINRFNALWQEEFAVQQKKTHQLGEDPTIDDAKYVIELAENSYFNACITSWYITRFLANEEQSIQNFNESINADYRRQIQAIAEKIEKVRPKNRAYIKTSKDGS